MIPKVVLGKSKLMRDIEGKREKELKGVIESNYHHHHHHCLHPHYFNKEEIIICIWIDREKVN